MAIRWQRSIGAAIRVTSRFKSVSADLLKRGWTAAGLPTLATMALAVVLSTVLVAAVGPVLVTGAPMGQNESGGTDAANGTAGPDDTVFADDPDELEAVVDDVIADQRAEHDIPGATVAVVEGDETVLTKGYGEADVTDGTPVRANETSFMIGSVGKLVTWTAVMQGVEDGTLDLDADVTTYHEESAVTVPETDDEPVTLRHLGTHTAGFETVLNPGMVADGDDVTSLETALIENRPERIRPPGETVGYSNYGAMLAGHVVADAHDTTFEEYVQSEIFEPLEMEHSTFVQPVPEDHPGDLAAPHTPTGDGVERADRVYINWRPAGSMSATAPEMATFMRAHLEDGAVGDARILEPETTETMHDVHHERHPAVTNWRYGLYEYGPVDAELIAHSGGTLHETSKLVLAPDEGVGIFVGYNVRNEQALPSAVVDELLVEYDLQPDTDTDANTDGDTLEPAAADGGSAERAAAVEGEYRPTLAPDIGPEQVVGLMMHLSLEATGDGRLEGDSLAFDDRTWIEREPYVYHEADGHDVLAAEVVDGDIVALHVSSMPQAAFEPVATYERTLVVGATAAIVFLGFVLSLFGWSGLAVWRRWERYRAVDATDSQSRSTDSSHDETDDAIRGRLESRLRRPAWLGRASAVALCVTSLSVGGLFVAGLGRHGDLAFITTPLSLRGALALSPLVGVLAVTTVIGSAFGWHRGYWSRRTRIHQTVVAVLGLLFVWLLFQIGFIGG